MNKPTGLILFAAVMLTACGSSPTRQVSTQPPAPVVEAQAMQSGVTSSAAAEPSAAPAPQAATQPGGGGYLEGDGPDANVPANLDATPDAVPQAEPLNRYANRPYVALGKTYTPLTAPGNYKERGIASWYGKKFHGQRTSSGEVYDMYAMTAAHPTLPIPSYARVTNPSNNKSVVVRINDRGPFLHDRIMDLSYTAAHKLGIIGSGSGEVIVESLTASSDAPVLATAATVTSVSLPPDPVPAAPVAPSPVETSTAGDIYLQLGAFKSQQGAESFLARMRTELDGSGKPVSLYQKDDLVRVHMGPYASADEARAIAEKLQARLGFKPMVSVH